ncbi:ubiquinol-cytochrome c reductase iron-sulfur subunit [Paraburkholderia sp. D1E]|uniref:ubiquinol-cytochrome c reductase iron-sulfur subunit n=1 Tax=Paraburkholderia sp. D1E TaxID=3461398 RepID=UPI004045B4D0
METVQSPHEDNSRRQWLITPSIAGGIAGVATLVPFVASMAPSEKSRAAGAPVAVDISRLPPGAMITVAWRGVPVFLVNRAPAMLQAVNIANSMVADPSTERPFSMPLPDYCKNEYRSRADHQNLLVVVGVCTHLGCTPRPRFEPGPQVNLPDSWPGDFLCPCHGSTYDLAGRVFKNKPAPENLDVPQFRFASATTVTIGENERGEA